MNKKEDTSAIQKEDSKEEKETFRDGTIDRCYSRNELVSWMWKAIAHNNGENEVLEYFKERSTRK